MFFSEKQKKDKDRIIGEEYKDRIIGKKDKDRIIVEEDKDRIIGEEDKGRIVGEEDKGKGRRETLPSNKKKVERHLHIQSSRFLFGQVLTGCF